MNQWTREKQVPSLVVSIFSGFVFDIYNIVKNTPHAPTAPGCVQSSITNRHKESIIW